MDRKSVFDDTSTYLMQTYRRLPVAPMKGRGSKLWGHDGKEYMDFVQGVATNVLGHCHPRVVIAIQKQAQRLMHVSNHFHIEPQAKAAKLLVEHSFADRAFFCNTGTEAIEGAIKLARKYAKKHLGEGKFEIIATENSFHGRTMGALSATGQPKFWKGFEPMLPGFKHVPFNDVEALRASITDATCAILLEPIQGESGVRIPSESYLNTVRTICDDYGILLILDEIQTGMGRTGKLFAYEHSGITPDIMTLAKGLGGGMPIGAILATESVAGGFEYGDHGSTFGGNPLACAAAIATIEVILEAGLILDNCRRMGELFVRRLKEIKDRRPALVSDVRGMGLLVGIELTKECGPVVLECIDKGLLINCAGGNTLRFMPPLTVEQSEVEWAMDVLDDVLGKYA